jgi:hypothetical protein
MRGRLAGFLLFVGAAVAPACGTPMSAAAGKPGGRCVLDSAAQLAAPSGDGDAICREIERAVAAAAPTTRYSVKVTVVSASRLSAVLIVNGRPLPEQNFAVMDRELNPVSIRRFAESLAAEVVKAAKE